jgi:hypothetical protein
MLKFTHYLAHKSVAAAATAGGLAPLSDWVELEVSSPETLHLQQRFAPFVQERAVRRINWVQTFARRGGNTADYAQVPCPGNSPTRAHAFLRRAEADPTLPAVVCFEQRASGDAVLQGEVITYLTRVPVIPLIELSHLVCPVHVASGNFASIALERTYSIERVDLLTLFKLIDSQIDRQHFDSRFLRSFDGARSVIAVRNAHLPC